jgi:hypothetical protein
MRPTWYPSSRRARDTVAVATAAGVQHETLDVRHTADSRVAPGGTLIADRPNAMDWFTGSWLGAGIMALLVMGILITAGVRYLEAQSRYDDEATRLQQALVEPLAHEPLLAGSTVLPIVSMPLHGLVRVEITGWVPSPEIRDAAGRVVERESARFGRRVRIVNRLEVVPQGIARPA